MRRYEEPGVTEARAPKAELGKPQERTANAVPGCQGSTLHSSAVLHLQRAAGNASVARLLGGTEEEEEESPVKQIVGSEGGAPLDAPLRTEMEASFGHDFSDVRVHTDSLASGSAKAINAHAYTSGTDVVFQSGMFNPDTESGKRTLAHELAHVVQQKAGPVSGTPAPGGILLSEPSDAFEREADRVADQVVSGEPTDAARGQSTGSTPGVQRHQQDGEEVQGFFVQRQAEGEKPVQDLFVQRQEGEEEEGES